MKTFEIDIEKVANLITNVIWDVYAESGQTSTESRADYTSRLVDALFEQLNNHIVEKSFVMEIVTQLVRKGLVETDVDN